LNQQEEIAYIVEQVAMGFVPSDDMGYECVHCNSTEIPYGDNRKIVADYEEPVTHEPNCAILVARRILREQGTPINIYHITGEVMRYKTPNRKIWEKCVCVMLAISEEKALSYWLAKEPRTFDAMKDYLSRNVIEGIVWHHPDGRMAKIKRKDMGLSWPVKR